MVLLPSILFAEVRQGRRQIRVGFLPRSLSNVLVHTNSDSVKRGYTNSERAKREKVCYLRDSITYYGTIEKVSNFEIAVAKLKEILRNIKFATL